VLLLASLLRVLARRAVLVLRTALPVRLGTRAVPAGFAVVRSLAQRGLAQALLERLPVLALHAALAPSLRATVILRCIVIGAVLLAALRPAVLLMAARLVSALTLRPLVLALLVARLLVNLLLVAALLVAGLGALVLLPAARTALRPRLAGALRLVSAAVVPVAIFVVAIGHLVSPVIEPCTTRLHASRTQLHHVFGDGLEVFAHLVVVTHRVTSVRDPTATGVAARHPGGPDGERRKTRANGRMRQTAVPQPWHRDVFSRLRRFFRDDPVNRSRVPSWEIWIHPDSSGEAS